MLTPVLGMKLGHQVGTLQVALSTITQAGQNIEYMYALATSGEDAIIVIKTTELEKSAEALKNAGIGLATTAEVEG